MANPKENVKKTKVPALSTNKWLLIALIFLFGVICILVSRQIRDNELFSLILDLIGGFLVVAIPIEILREAFFEEDNTAVFVAQVSQIFDEKIDAELIQARKIGLVSIEDSLPIKSLFTELQPGDTLWWLDTFAPGHKSWIDHVTRAIQRGAFVNMLIIDPKSPFCAMRAREIGNIFTEESFLAELSLFIADFKECRKNLNKQKNLLGHLNLVLYDDLLGMPIYLVTREGKPIYAYSSMYLSKPTGVDFPHFFWKDGSMCEILFQYVRGKYDLAKVKQKP